MTKLPSIYKEKISSSKQHNKTTCYVTNKEDLAKELDIIFDNKPLYYQKVFIETPFKTYHTRIIERRENELITMNKERIPLQDIQTIKRIS